MVATFALIDHHLQPLLDRLTNHPKYNIRASLHVRIATHIGEIGLPVLALGRLFPVLHG